MATTPWTIRELLEATAGALLRGDPDTTVSSVAIDSRTLQAGQVFVAITGRRFDGHQFLSEAAHRGSACLIVSQRPTASDGWATLPMIVVEETTRALGDLARYHRRRCGVPVVAITGSCGKTTTKELVAKVLGGSPAILKNQGTQNNHIGVPLTLLQLASPHTMAVVECGANHLGEIAYLASVAQPDIALITNIGPAHLEFFGSIANVLREKLSLVEAVPSEGAVVLPGDQLDVCLEASHRLRPRVRVVTFGTTDRCDVQAVDIQRSAEGMTMRLRDHAGRWVIPLVGYHNVENTLAAIACAWAVGVPLSAIKERLRACVPVPLRSEVVRCQGLVILNDCYNANPLSFARALETLRDLPARRRVAIMGDMLELGDHAPSAHHAIGRLAGQLGIDLVMAVGQYAPYIAEGVRERRTSGVATYQNVPELLEELPDVLQSGDGVLVKGSRKLNLEDVTAFLMARYQGAHGVPS